MKIINHTCTCTCEQYDWNSELQWISTTKFMNVYILGFISSIVIYHVASFSWAKNNNTLLAPSSPCSSDWAVKLWSYFIDLNPIEASVFLLLHAFPFPKFSRWQYYQAFAVAAPRIWNGLPSIKKWGTRRMLIILSSFKRHLFII